MNSQLRPILPNLLTVLRLVLSAAFFVLLSIPFTRSSTAWMNIALAIFIIGALTDWLDGYLARRWHAVTTFGRVMDPFCDKVLVLGGFILLAGPHFAEAGSGVASWMVVVILARELLVTTLRGMAEAAGVSFPASRSGKAKMLLQSITVPMCLLIVTNFDPSESIGWRIVRDILVWATVIVTTISAVPYFVRGRSVLLNSSNHSARR